MDVSNNPRMYPNTMPPKFDPHHHHRRSIRLKGYDYTQAGAYFVTIVTHQRECLCGEINNGVLQLNPQGQRIAECWEALARHFPFPELDSYVIMPNHLHGIVVLTRALIDERRGEAFAETSAQREASAQANASPLPPRGTKPGSLNAVIQNFKSVSTRKINQMQNTAGNIIWQRNYYEHIIHSEPELERIRAYIENNPAQWTHDTENPTRGPNG